MILYGISFPLITKSGGNKYPSAQTVAIIFFLLILVNFVTLSCSDLDGCVRINVLADCRLAVSLFGITSDSSKLYVRVASKLIILKRCSKAKI